MKSIITLLVRLSAFFFNVAFLLEQRLQDKQGVRLHAKSEPKQLAEPEPEDTYEDEGDDEEALVSENETSKPLFRGEDGEQIPMNLDPLPEFRIFEAMFARKYGKFGRMPMTISGQQKTFNVYEMYTLLQEISKRGEMTPMMQAIYGSVMSVIMQAHGEKLDPKFLN